MSWPLEAGAPFRILTPAVDPVAGRLKTAYEVPGFGVFEETVTFPQGFQGIGADALDRLVVAASVVMGTSYYKLNPALEIVIEPEISPSLLALARDTYSNGLGEFFVRNGLAFPPEQRITATLSEAAPPASDPAEGRRAVVAFGGGKDSHVAAAILDRAGWQAAPTSVILSDRVGARLQSMSSAPLTLIRRVIDPRLIELGRAGQGLNGHIPITAINSLVLTIQAAATGRDAVVFANERAASAPTLRLENGAAVNHQHSKSLGYEALLRGVVGDALGGAVSYFSILRPASELWTARRLVGLGEDVLARFASCNRNFVFEGPEALPEDRNWCMTCPKCVYTAVLLATAVSPAKLVEIMGGNPLEITKNQRHLAQLCGLTDAKPWECVGEVEEVAAAVDALLADPDWRGVALLKGVAPALRDIWPDPAALKARYDASNGLAGPHFIPGGVLRAML